MHIEEQQERWVLFLPGRVRGGDLGPTLAALMPRVYQHVQALGIVPTTSPFTRFEGGLGAEDGAVDAGLGVPPGTRGAGGLSVGTLPGGPAAVRWHLGDYEGLRAARAALWAELAASADWEPAGAGWEIYWEDLAAPGALPTLRTELVQPVRPRAHRDPSMRRSWPVPPS